VRPGDRVATLSQPGQPDRRISLPRRNLEECLADELRRLDPDTLYADTVMRGLDGLGPIRLTAAKAAASGLGPDLAASKRLAARLRRGDAAEDASAMIAAPPAPEDTDLAQVRSATARKLAGKRTPRERQRAKSGKAGEGRAAEPS
jgi:hypothetical protein